MEATEPDLDLPSHVMVVEDEPLLRSLVADELREAGFNVIEATDAEEALSYIRAGTNIDLVFTDVQMPGHVDGLNLAATLKRDQPGLPVIITSGSANPDEVGELGWFIRKPYRLTDVIGLVARTLDVKPRGRQS